MTDPLTSRKTRQNAKLQPATGWLSKSYLSNQPTICVCFFCVCVCGLFVFLACLLACLSSLLAWVSPRAHPQQPFGTPRHADVSPAPPHHRAPHFQAWAARCEHAAVPPSLVCVGNLAPSLTARHRNAFGGEAILTKWQPCTLCVYEAVAGGGPWTFFVGTVTLLGTKHTRDETRHNPSSHIHSYARSHYP